jgi:chromosome segregation ATPase
MWNDAEGTRELLCEILNESRRTVKFASASADKAMALSEKAAKRTFILIKKLQTSTSLINELKDEINDERRTIDDLEKKVGEYDEVIDWMEHEYEEKCKEYETRMDSLKTYYEAIIKKNSTRYVMKHWVKNKSRGEYVYVMLLIVSFDHCLTYPHAYQLLRSLSHIPTCLPTTSIIVSHTHMPTNYSLAYPHDY